MDPERQVCAFYYRNNNANDIEGNQKAKRRPGILAIVLIILLVIFLTTSVFVLKQRTNFLNFASSFYEKEITKEVTKTLQTPSATTTTNIETSNLTQTQISTNSSTMIIPVPSSTPISVPGSVVIENSYIFASPLTAATGNIERIRITVFILDGTGSGIPDKTVTLTGVEKLAVYSVQAVTDTIGRALFDIAAGTSGTYEIGATIGGVSIPQKISVNFD